MHKKKPLMLNSQYLGESAYQPQSPSSQNTFVNREYKDLPTIDYLPSPNNTHFERSSELRLSCLKKKFLHSSGSVQSLNKFNTQQPFRVQIRRRFEEEKQKQF